MGVYVEEERCLVFCSCIFPITELVFSFKKNKIDDRVLQKNKSVIISRRVSCFKLKLRSPGTEREPGGEGERGGGDRYMPMAWGWSVNASLGVRAESTVEGRVVVRKDRGCQQAK